VGTTALSALFDNKSNVISRVLEPPHGFLIWQNFFGKLQAHARPAIRAMRKSISHRRFIRVRCEGMFIDEFLT